MAGFGLRLVRSQGMEGYTGNLNEYPVDPTNTNPIFTGDPVIIDANGYVVEATGGADNSDLNVWGVFAGVRFIDSDGSVEFRQFWDGNSGRTDVLAHVALPPHSVFVIRGAEGATYTRANTIGKRFGFTYAPGSTLYGDSRVTLGAATAATGPLIVHKLGDFPNNTWESEQPIFEVTVARPSGFLAVAS